MEIWLIKDGEKAGPFHDYEIRRRIGTGDLEASSPAWHEGLPAWTTLSEIALFREEFIEKPLPEEPPVQPEPPPLPPSPPVIPGKPRIVRRFWARWLDIYLYVGLWWFLMWLTGRNIESLATSPVVAMTRLIPWFVIEILLIHRFATTPGKWLLGLKVTNLDGSHLTLGQSTRRALRVYFVGIGFAIPYVLPFCMVLSAYTAKRIGAPVWDHVGKHGVNPKPLIPWKIAAVVVTYAGVLLLQFLVLSPVMTKFMMRDLNTEEGKPLRDYLEKHPFWSLPPRDQ
ncbi:MAG: RDD family protein [Akkermansiaceae bacterium]|nr:RDD family protein [Akkermansiaceae bacterium]